MKHERATKITAILMLFILFSSIGGVLAFQIADDDPTTTDSDDETEVETETEIDEYEPEYERDSNGTVWVQSDIMSVRLDSNHPSYQFWYSNDVNGSLAKFSVSYRMVVEFEDLNGDGVYQVNETIAFVPLDAFDWNLQTGSITNEAGRNEEIYVTYIKGGLSSDEYEDGWFDDWMPGYDHNEGDFISSDDDGLDLSKYETMTLQFYGHIYMDDYMGLVSDDEGVQANYTVSGGVEFKIDIEIGNFPFESNTSKIAILNYLEEDLASNEDSNHRFVTHEDDGDKELESEDIDETYGEKFDDVDDNHDGEDDDIQGIALTEGSTNTTRGFYRWVDSALMTLPNSTTQAVNVGASYWTNGEAMLLFLAYPNFDGGSLIHDPSLKLEEQSNPVPFTPTTNQNFPIEFGIAAVGIVAIIAIAAIAMKKR